VNPVSQNWQLCRLSSPPEHADAATNWLLEHGCEGVQIEDTAIVFDQSEDATLVPREEVTLTGYRVENPLETPEDLVRALSELPSSRFANRGRAEPRLGQRVA
jgi:ribosomal protein L11 methylase PrmA